MPFWNSHSLIIVLSSEKRLEAILVPPSSTIGSTITSMLVVVPVVSRKFHAIVISHAVTSIARIAVHHQSISRAFTNNTHIRVLCPARLSVPCFQLYLEKYDNLCGLLQQCGPILNWCLIVLLGLTKLLGLTIWNGIGYFQSYSESFILTMPKSGLHSWWCFKL